MDDPSQFYTGMIADLYEPLAGGLPDVAPYQRFIDRFGGPTLELGCGSGLPMLDLMELGYEIEGLDASKDMLRVCKAKALERNLNPILHEGLFQNFQLNKQFASIYIASASFTLLVNDEDAIKTLRQIHDHLLPNGVAWIPLEIPDTNQLAASINQFKTSIDDKGNTIKVGMIDYHLTDNDRNLVISLQYEREIEGTNETVVRAWQRRSWNEAQFTALAQQAGWHDITFLPKDPTLRNSAFVALLRV